MSNRDVLPRRETCRLSIPERGKGCVARHTTPDTRITSVQYSIDPRIGTAVSSEHSFSCCPKVRKVRSTLAHQPCYLPMTITKQARKMDSREGGVSAHYVFITIEERVNRSFLADTSTIRLFFWSNASGWSIWRHYLKDIFFYYRRARVYNDNVTGSGARWRAGGRWRQRETRLQPEGQWTRCARESEVTEDGGGMRGEVRN